MQDWEKYIFYHRFVPLVVLLAGNRPTQNWLNRKTGFRHFRIHVILLLHYSQ